MSHSPSSAAAGHAAPAEPTEHFDVVIAGAGPSGLMTALEVAGAGARVLVLEKRGEPALSRAGVLQTRVMEIFAMRGLAEAVLERAEDINGDKHLARRGIWAGLPHVDFGLLDSDFPYVVMLSQIEVEQILAARCIELGAVIRRGAEVVDVTQDDDEVTVRYRSEGTERTASAAYAVGADGGRSAVRTALGIPWVGHDARNLAVNVDAEIPFPFSEPVVVVNNERGWGMAYPLSEQVTRLAVIDARTMLDVARDRVIGHQEAIDSVQRVFGRDFGISTARVSQFHDALFRAAAVRQGRVFLVGESVRVHYPASGVGMNFALQDAFNLGWKLAAAVQGWGEPELLDSYASEREPEIDDHLDHVRAQTALQFSFTEESIALKNLMIDTLLPLAGTQHAIAEKLSGLSAHYGRRGDLVGGRVRDLPTADGRRLSEVISPGTYVLVSPPDAARPGVSAHARITPVVAELPHAEGALVLVRPDGYVAFAGSADDIEAYARRARLQ